MQCDDRLNIVNWGVNMVGKIEEIPNAPFRDVPATLRKIAENIEQGMYSPISASLVMNCEDGLEIFGMGKGEEEHHIVLLMRGHNKLLRILGEI
jgi:hypothetical protein